MPQIALWRLVSPRFSTVMLPLSSLAPTSSVRMSESWPFGPFIFTRWPSTAAVTPEGIATGLLPIFDMNSLPDSSEHRTENFAADVLLARVVVGQHAFRRRQNRDAETVIDARQVSYRHIDAPARLRHARDLADHRRAVEILELDFEFGAAVLVLGLRKAANEAFRLQHFQHARTKVRAGCRHARLVAHRGVADARNHIADRIVHRHDRSSLPARLHEAGNLARRAELAHRDTRDPHLAVIAARPAGDLATVADALLGGVARQLRELQYRREAVFDRQFSVL